MSLEGCRFGGLGRMAVRIVADSSKKQKLQRRQLASVGYGSRQYIGRKVCTPLPSESACGLAFLCDNAAACSAIGGRQLLFLAEKRKPASCGFEENRNGAPSEHLLEPRSARSGPSFCLGYHALRLRHNLLLAVLVEVRDEVDAALVGREQEVLAVVPVAYDLLVHVLGEVV